MKDNRDASSEGDRAATKRRSFSPFDGSVGTIATVVIAITAVLTLVLNFTQGGPAASGPTTTAMPPESATEASTALPSFSESDSSLGTVEAQPDSALGCWIDANQRSCGHRAMHPGRLGEVHGRNTVTGCSAKRPQCGAIRKWLFHPRHRAAYQAVAFRHPPGLCRGCLPEMLGEGDRQ